MKKYFTLILASVILLLSLVNGWFLDQIVDRSIFWGFVPSALLIVLFIICFRDAIRDIKEAKKLKDSNNEKKSESKSEKKSETKKEIKAKKELEYEIKSRAQFAKVGLFILFINIVLVIIIPFRSIRVDIDFDIFYDERSYLIDKIESYEIAPNEDGEVSIHSMYSGISSNRRIHVYDHDDDYLTVGFYVSEKMPFKSAMLIYTNHEKSSFNDLLNIKEELEIKEIDKNWYFIEYKK